MPNEALQSRDAENGIKLQLPLKLSRIHHEDLRGEKRPGDQRLDRVLTFDRLLRSH